MASQNRTTASDRGKVIDDVPDQTVTIGAATAISSSSATVAFTTGSVATGGPVTFFTATSTPGSLTANASTSPITVSGLTAETSYTFKVKAGNSTGFSSAGDSAASNSVVPPLDSSYESIATVTLDTNTTRVVISSIPQTYKHLQVRLLGRSTRAVLVEAAWLSFNGDYGSSSGLYTNHLLTADGAAVTSADITPTQGGIAYGLVPCANAASNIFGSAVIDILDYTNTSKLKVGRSLTGEDRNGSGIIRISSGVWRSGDAITSIAFDTQQGGNFTPYSSFALYGIKGA
jgi:hypothetical protein